MDKAGAYAKASEKAFRFLSIRGYSEKELRQKLKSGGFPAAVVDEVIEQCRELGYINDVRFACTLAVFLATDRLFGNRRISFYLQERGISGDIAAGAIAAADGELAEEERIRKTLGKRRMGRPASENNGDPSVLFKEKARVVRSLMGRGFPLELILQVINEKEEEGLHDNDGE